MPFEIVVDTDARILRARYTGEVGMDDRRRFARQVMEKAQRSGIYRWLLDFRQAQVRSADPDDIVRMADEFSPRLPPGVRMAYLVMYHHQLDDSLEGLMRDRGVQVERFHDRETAVGWLQDDDAGGPAAPPATTMLSRALRLAAEAIGPAARVSPDQFVAMGELVHELLASGLDDATVMRIARRMVAAMDASAPP